jgi:hypothetical protein
MYRILGMLQGQNFPCLTPTKLYFGEGNGCCSCCVHACDSGLTAKRNFGSSRAKWGARYLKQQAKIGGGEYRW